MVKTFSGIFKTLNWAELDRHGILFAPFPRLSKLLPIIVCNCMDTTKDLLQPASAPCAFD